VAGQKLIPPRTLSSILRQAGLSTQELQQLVERGALDA
jgi:hypothetical protein